MSAQTSSDASRVRNVSTVSRFVLLILANGSGGGDGTDTASLRGVADQAGLTPEALDMAIDELVSNGHIRPTDIEGYFEIDPQVPESGVSR